MKQNRINQLLKAKRAVYQRAYYISDLRSPEFFIMQKAYARINNRLRKLMA